MRPNLLMTPARALATEGFEPGSGPAPHPAMNALEQALNAERAALQTQDVEGLMRATEAKLVAVRQLERNPPTTAAHELARLQELNRANGALLARRRRLVQWSLRALGRTGAASDYNSAGQSRVRTDMRALAVY
jgi:flagellar biosynthesis/type III secretory pathway chaperone